MSNQNSEFGIQNLESCAIALRTRHSPLATQRGSILLYVVWAIALLSLFAASIGSQAIFSLGVSERLTEQLRTSYVARAGAQYAALVLAHDSTESIDGLTEPWLDSPGRFQHQMVGD